MKNILRFLFVVFCLFISMNPLHAQSSEWIWAKSAGGLSPDYAHSINVDGSGNIFVAGEFEARSITFGSITLKNAGDTSYTDMYLAKLSSITGVEENNDIPNEFYLFQNYPNPFNPTTNITFTLPSRSYALLKIYDVIGREIATLVNSVKEAGTYTTTWNAQDCPSGVYFYRLTVGSYTMTRKLLLLR